MSEFRTNQPQQQQPRKGQKMSIEKIIQANTLAILALTKAIETGAPIFVQEPKAEPKAAEPKAAEPKAAEPKAAEPKAAEPKADAPVLTFDQVKDKMLEVLNHQKGGQEALKELLEKLGVARLPELEGIKYAEAMSLADAFLKGVA